MTELTKTMKPVCIGRYLLDVPEQAEFSLGDAEISRVKLEREPKPAINQQAFDNKLQAMEARFRALPHITEGTQLKEVFQENSSQRFLIHRSDERDVDTLVIDGLVRIGEIEYKFSKQSSDETVSSAKEQIITLANALHPRTENIIPTTAGFCISGAVLQTDGNRRDGYSESISGGIQLADWPVDFGIRTETSGAREAGATMLDRMDKANRLAGVSPHVIRRGETLVDQRKGQEYIVSYSENGLSYLDADAEIYGDGSSKLPTFKINMTVTKIDKPDPSDKRKVMSNEEALALWDAVLKSIRPRPNAF